MKRYYQPEIETMPVEQIKALQSERLVEQVKYVYDHVEFYRNRMDEAGGRNRRMFTGLRIYISFLLSQKMTFVTSILTVFSVCR